MRNTLLIVILLALGVAFVVMYKRNPSTGAAASEQDDLYKNLGDLLGDKAAAEADAANAINDSKRKYELERQAIDARFNSCKKGCPRIIGRRSCVADCEKLKSYLLEQLANKY